MEGTTNNQWKGLNGIWWRKNVSLFFYYSFIVLIVFSFLSYSLFLMQYSLSLSFFLSPSFLCLFFSLVSLCLTYFFLFLFSLSFSLFRSFFFSSFSPVVFSHLSHSFSLSHSPLLSLYLNLFALMSPAGMAVLALLAAPRLADSLPLLLCLHLLAPRRLTRRRAARGAHSLRDNHFGDYRCVENERINWILMND